MDRLPLSTCRKELLRAVNENVVLVIKGKAGCGKSTGLPQLLHEAAYTKRGKIVCAQPRSISTMWKALQVLKRMGFELGQEVGFCTAQESLVSPRTFIEYTTHDVLFREFREIGGELRMAEYSVFIVDEAQERLIASDMLLALLKSSICTLPDLAGMKLLICSTSSAADKLSMYFGGVPIVPVDGNLRVPHGMSISYEIALVVDYIEAAVEKILHIHMMEDAGDILAFCPGQYETEYLKRVLTRRSSDVGMGNLALYCLYDDLPPALLMESDIFKETPLGIRKVILATRTAESCISVPGVRYVVDTGFTKLEWHSKAAKAGWIMTTAISKTTAEERASQVNSPLQGKCFRL